MSTHPKRRVFYSFHFERDAWRAGQVRNIGVTEHDEPVSDNAWETIRRRGEAAIRKWIDDQMSTRSCVIVLIGSQTANRQWINYEISQAWNNCKGLLGVRIHRLLNREGRDSPPGSNTFEYVKFKGTGTSLSNYIPVHDPPGADSKNVYAHISNNLEQWVERAIQSSQTRR